MTEQSDPYAIFDEMIAAVRRGEKVFESEDATRKWMMWAVPFMAIERKKEIYNKEMRDHYREIGSMRANYYKKMERIDTLFFIALGIFAVVISWWMI